MCNNICKKNEQNELQELEQKILIMFAEPVLVDRKNIEDLTFDRVDFNKGLKDSSYISGFYTGLVNSGWDQECAMNYLMAKLSHEIGLEIAKINASSNIEVSKNTPMVLEKQNV